MTVTSGGSKHLEAHEGSIFWVLGDLYRFKLNSADTGGTFALWETVSPPGNPGPPPHRHLNQDETFILLEGEVDFTIEGEVRRLGPGGIVFVPRGTAHTFRNAGDKPARFLASITPGGFEEFFRAIGIEATDLSAPPQMGEPPDVAALVALARSFDCEIFPPPEVN